MRLFLRLGDDGSLCYNDSFATNKHAKGNFST